ncbi:zinc ribbon domain-containing protein [Streptomyces sp. NPDC006290]|uniref:zinc ribbon domain-containing protein n=1 Tax=Streptomyces sp. NPDC006290 TaxID=3156745 RepID=UPI0033B0C8EF
MVTARRHRAVLAGPRVQRYTSLRCSACGWIDKNSRKSQAEFVCSSCGFTCNADERSSQRRGRTGRDPPPPALSRCRRGDNGHRPSERP